MNNQTARKISLPVGILLHIVGVIVILFAAWKFSPIVFTSTCSVMVGNYLLRFIKWLNRPV